MLILASGSPRRKELLKKVFSDYTVIVPNIDERILDLDPKDLPAEESKEKAYAIHALYPNDAVLACDTIVVLNGEILGKPKDEADAIRMLKLQSGKRQVVLSGYTYIDAHKEVTRTVMTYVYFNVLSDELIAAYVKDKKPLDKAGAYGIQDGYPLINHIEGSFDNVMGLPTEDIAKHCLN
jgi:septum formation protein